MEYKRREAQNFRFRMHLGTVRCSILIDNLAMSYKNVLVKSCARMLCGHGHLLQCTVHSVTSYKHFLSRVWYNGQNYCILVANWTRFMNGYLSIFWSTADGGKTWQNQERLPACNLRTLLSHYLDITTPASQTLLALFAAHASSEEDKRRLQLLATVNRSLSS